MAGRYVTLGDYARVLRRFWFLILVLAVVGAGAGYANAARQTASYEATASVSFQDPVSDLNIVGLGSNTFQSPAALAAVNASTFGSPSVQLQVKKELGLGDDGLLATSSIAANVSTSNGLLLLTATSPQASFAAQYANTVANVLVAQDNAQVRAQFRQLVSQIQARVATLTKPAKGVKAADNASQLSFYEDELARLQTVAEFATTAKLSTAATTPGGPTSPKKARSLVIGLVVGLLLGILAAFVRDATDRRLRSNSDVAEGLPFPIVGRLRNRSMGRVLKVSDAKDKNGWADVEAFRILRRNLEALPSATAGHTTVLVTSAVPEEGKSTVASSLALSLALSGRRTLLVDCDLRRPSLASRLELKRTPGLAEYLAGEAGPGEILRTVDLASSFAGIDGTLAGKSYRDSDTAPVSKLVCIPAGATRRDAPELLGSDRFKTFVEEIRGFYDVIVFDSSPLLPVADTLEIIPNADAILLCVRHSRTTHEQAQAALVAIEQFESRPTGIVITGLKPRSNDSQLYMYSYDYYG